MTKNLVILSVTISVTFFCICGANGQSPNSQDVKNKFQENEKKVSIEKKPIINFSTTVDDNSVSKLITTINYLIALGFRDILLIMNSSGGDLDAGISAYNYLSSLPITLRTHNISRVDSAAVYIYCSGKIKTASPYSSFVVHNGTSSFAASQTIGEINGTYKAYKLKLEFAHQIFANCAGITQKQSQSIFYSDSVFNSSEARRLGFVDNVNDVKFSEVPFITPINGNFLDHQIVPTGK